jgi:hypothetical protein
VRGARTAARHRCRPAGRGPRDTQHQDRRRGPSSEPRGVEAGEGLLEDEELGGVRERACERHPLLVPVRQVLDEVVGSFAETEPFEPGRGRGRGGRRRYPLGPRNPTSCSGATAKFTPSSARRSPNRTARPSTSRPLRTPRRFNATTVPTSQCRRVTVGSSVMSLIPRGRRRKTVGELRGGRACARKPRWLCSASDSTSGTHPTRAPP